MYLEAFVKFPLDLTDEFITRSSASIFNRFPIRPSPGLALILHGINISTKNIRATFRRAGRVRARDCGNRTKERNAPNTIPISLKILTKNEHKVKRDASR